MDGLDKVVDALRAFLDALVQKYGATGTLIIAASVVGIAIAWRIYNDRKKDKEVNEALAEKERTIQRLAEENREWRVLFFRDKAGWSDEDVEKYVLKAQFPDGPTARRHMESRKPELPPDVKVEAESKKSRRKP